MSAALFALGMAIELAAPRLVVAPDPASTSDTAAQSRMMDAAKAGASRMNDAAVSTSSETCPDPSCVARVLDETGSDAMVRVRLEVEGRDYTFRVELLDGKSEPLVSTDRCEVCGLEEVAALVEDSAATLVDRFVRAQAPGSITLNTQPAGAEVLRDGVSLGTTPLTTDLPPGRYEVELKLPGYEPQRRTFSVGPSESAVIDAELSPLPPPPPPWRPMAIAGGVAIATGVVGIGVGAALVAIDERAVDCTDSEANDFGVCPRRYSTLEGGAASLALGGVLLVTGVVLEVVGLRRRAQAKRLTWTGPAQWRF